jgi:predicted nucleotidyltransferase
MAKNEIIIVLKQFLAALKAEGINIEKAFLYGSHAKGIATANSDIDIMLVSDYFDKGIKARAKSWLVASKIDHRIEPCSISMKKFLEDDSSPLIETVKQEGVEII